MVQTVKNLPAMQETQVQSLGQEDPVEKGMATHSGIFAWRIPWSLAGCSPQDRKELDTTEWLTQRLIRYYSIQNTFNLFIFTWYTKIRIFCNLINHLSAAAAAAKSLQSCPTLCDPRLPCPWDSPGKNTGVGCHFLLQCMKVKSQSEVAQSYPTPSDPMNCSLPGSSVHEICQARVLEWIAIAFSEPSL